MSPEPSGRVGEQAVVIGAGFAGLTAARALAGAFERVVVLERDDLPEQAAPRSGVPQGRHLHAMLGGGLRALNEIFPGFEIRLAEAGAVAVRIASDMWFEVPGYQPFPQRDLGWNIYSMTRPLLEHLVRQEVERTGNIVVRSGLRVTGIVPSGDGHSVVGVRIATVRATDEVVQADLVIDASGRGAPTFEFLKAIGHPLPEETVIGIDIGYATALFAIPDDAPPAWTFAITHPQAPVSSRLALLVPVEGRRWIVTVMGAHDEKPDGSWDGFFAAVAQLRTPTILNAIRHAERLGEVARFALPASVRRHFDRLASFPRGLLPIGDVLCRFNPVFGQGMSVRAQEACLLSRLLGTLATEADPLGRLASTFFAEAQALNETPWVSAAIPDLVYPQTTGERPPDFASRLQYAAALRRLGSQEPAVQKLITEVQHLLKPPSALGDPELVQRVKSIMAQA